MTTIELFRKGRKVRTRAGEGRPFRFRGYIDLNKK